RLPWASWKRTEVNVGTATGAQLLVRMLKAEGVRHLFTLSGLHIAPIYAACVEEGIAIVDTRHEQAAAHAADATARLTRGVGIRAAGDRGRQLDPLGRRRRAAGCLRRATRRSGVPERRWPGLPSRGSPALLLADAQGRSGRSGRGGDRRDAARLPARVRRRD